MSTNLSSYFPRLLVEWQQETPDAGWRAIEGTLVFMDISGFTAMSERLARHGKVGAEEVTEILNDSFTKLLSAAYDEGGYLLKFGGDAMLLFFAGPSHAARGCRCAVRMRRTLREVGRIRTTAGLVRLRMSVGVHSDLVHFFLAGDSHRELMVTGPAVTRVVEMEGAASAGQVLISDQTAAAIPASCSGRPLGGGRLLERAPNAPAGSFAAPPAMDGDQPEVFIPTAIRDHLLGTDATESEHRQALVCFIHFEDVDHLLTSAGPDAAQLALDQLVRTVQRAAADFNVCFLGSDVDRDGGKIILTAGVPRSSGNDDEGMLRAVRQILESDPPLPLRIGVNAGPVFAGDVGPAYRRTYTVMGDAVNLAARLMAKAAPGQALAVPAVVERARTRFQLTSIEPFHVKGKAKPVTAVAVGAAAGTRGQARPGRVVPLVGRDQEIRLLDATLDSVRPGRRAIVNLVGDPGMGKSRIVEELKARTQGYTAVETACEQYESSTPYFPLRRLLRSLLRIAQDADPTSAAQMLAERVAQAAPALSEWLPLIAIPLDLNVPSTPSVERIADRFRKGQLQRVVCELVATLAPEPAIFIVEDAHWLDEASRDLLGELIAGSTSQPWLFLVTRRPSDAPLFADLDPESATIVLEPLSAQASAELASAAVGTVALGPHELAALAERAGGNPLFVREIVAARSARGDAETLPDSLEALITAQIDRLQPADRRALRYASVVGPTFNVRLLADSLGELPAEGSASTWERLSDFVTPEGNDSFRFKHALVREAAYEGLPFRRRRDLHERLALNIERRHGRRADRRAELLSLHFHRAGSYEKALRYSRMAGDRSKEKYANVEAAEFYRRAIDAARHLPDTDPAELARVHQALGDVCELAGMYREAEDAYRQARRCFRGDPKEQQPLFRKEGVIRERLGQYTQALRWYGRGLRSSDGASVRHANELRLAYAGVRFRQGRYADCARSCRQVLQAAEAAGDRASLAHAYYLLDHAHTMLGTNQAGQYRALALPIFEELGDLVGQANVLNNLGVAATMEGRWDEAIRCFERSKQAREKVGDVVGAATADNNIGEVLLDRGEFEEAEARFRDALRVWRGANYAVGVAVATSALGRSATRAGRFDEATSLLGDALESFREMGAESFVAETQARLAELRLFAGDGEGVLALVAETLPHSEAGGMVAVNTMLHRLRGYALMRRREWDAARAAIDESLRLARSTSAEYEVALSLQARASLATATGEDPEPYLEESMPIFERLGIIAMSRIDWT
jgi:class 3 adenylate cyclase/tetratricopeptide (TPR) repeat protein